MKGISNSHRSAARRKDAKGAVPSKSESESPSDLRKPRIAGSAPPAAASYPPACWVRLDQVGKACWASGRAVSQTAGRLPRDARPEFILPSFCALTTFPRSDRSLANFHQKIPLSGPLARTTREVGFGTGQPTDQLSRAAA